MGGQKPQGEGQEYGGEQAIYHHELPSKKDHKLCFVLLTAQRMPSLCTRRPAPGMLQILGTFLVIQATVARRGLLRATPGARRAWEEEEVIR